ncbi:MAG: putative rane protein, partial [Acidobacteriota bacterium]|nr:putative rane protein [Acidobacteriota bacterium]
MHTRKMSGAAIGAAMLLMTACAHTGDMTPMPGAIPPPDVAGIVATANQGEIEQGQAASSKATSSDVRSFAQMMVTDHTAALTTARETFARAGVTPADNDTTRQLQATSARTVTNLSTYSGTAFDRTYMQSQVDLHQWLLTSLDTALIPSSTGEMRTLLETQR